MAETQVEMNGQTAVAVADDLVAAGRPIDAISCLRAGLAGGVDPAVLERLIAVRHRAFTPSGDRRRGEREATIRDPFPGEGIPEVDVDELTPRTLAAALDHRGSLLVRGLLRPDVASDLLGDVMRAFDAVDSYIGGTPASATTPWYVPFEAVEGYTFGPWERAAANEGGGLLAVESPGAFENLVAAFSSVRLGEVLEGYFGEWPALSAKKTTLRRARPGSGQHTEWHQDGAFLGADTRSVNVWLALNRCGSDAPTIDLYPHAYDQILETGGDGARFDWSVAPERARRSSDASPIRACFEPGDAMLFDQMTLHRSGIAAEMTRDRYSVESWFFAPSTFPYDQVPILF